VRHGRHCGDLVLQRIAGVLNRVMRRGDFVARFAGDEFVVVLPGAGQAQAGRGVPPHHRRHQRRELAGAGAGHPDQPGGRLVRGGRQRAYAQRRPGGRRRQPRSHEMSTIELGEISSAPDDQPTPEFDLRFLRRLAFAASVLLCLLCAAGSSRPAPHAVRALWSVPISESDGTTLGSDTLYVHRGTELTAYDLATGVVRWRTAVENTAGYAQLAEADDLLLLPADPQTVKHGNALSQFSRATIAVDASTGTRLWSTPGEPMVVGGGTVLMAQYSDTASFARLRLLRLDDRETVWSGRFRGSPPSRSPWPATCPTGSSR
jgi:hypothetical protein